MPRLRAEPNLKVLHIQREVPHYKKGFFEALSSSGDFDYTLVLIKSIMAKEYQGSVALDELCNSGINCVEIEGRAINLFGNTIEIYPALLRFFLRNRPDVILWGALTLFGSKYIDACVFSVLKSVSRARFVAGWSDPALSVRGPLHHLLRRINHKLVYGHFDSYVTYGKKSKAVLIQRGVQEKDIFVGHNSLDTVALEAIKQQLLATEDAWNPSLRLDLGIDVEDKVVLFLARITPLKRLDLIIKAFPKILQQTDSAVALIIVGDGDDKDYYRSLAAQTSVAESIIFKDGIYDDVAVAKVFLLSDVVVYPGQISLSTHFAMVMGKPFVCVPYGGNEVEYALDQENCLHFQPGSADDLATKVSTLLKNPTLQARFGQVSQELVATKANIHNKVNGYRNAVRHACRH